MFVSRVRGVKKLTRICLVFLYTLVLTIAFGKVYNYYYYYHHRDVINIIGHIFYVCALFQTLVVVVTRSRMRVMEKGTSRAAMGSVRQNSD